MPTITAVPDDGEPNDQDKPRKAYRAHGDGGLYWSESRQRYIAEVTVGYKPNGKRIVRKASGRTKTEAKNKLKEILRDLEDGTVTNSPNYTIADAVNDFLRFGLAGRSEGTVKYYTSLANTHVIPDLGKRKARELSATDVDIWLTSKSKHLSTRTLRGIRSVLMRSLKRAQARDMVKRNVVQLCDVPQGRAGRPSKSLTLDQAIAVLKAAETSLRAYIVLSLLIGARTEEMRALRARRKITRRCPILLLSDVVRDLVDLRQRHRGDGCMRAAGFWSLVHIEGGRQVRRSLGTLASAETGHLRVIFLRALRWARVDLVGEPDADPPVPPSIEIWRSVWATGDTKTRKSRRTLALPQRAVEALAAHGETQNKMRDRYELDWTDDDLVFETRTGTALYAANVRREYRSVAWAAGLNPKEWTPREL